MSDLIGRNLGPYRIIEQIGRGGMATVYKAYQASIDRYVAVKVLPAHFMQDPTFLERFDREARTIARLEHPHILPVHDYGRAEDGTTYIAMRFVEAGTLADMLESSVLFLEDAYDLFVQIAEALAYAHEQGVVHRDMKPSNVLVDMNSQAFLTDFGLAKIMEGDSSLTGNMILGTPTYMAPEQGEGQPADERSDIYALGIILYEMTTGRPPFQAETPMAVMLKHITEPLPLPRKINPDLPETIERVILKSLAKEPDDRFQSVADFLAALKEAMRAVTSTAPTRRVEAAPAVEPAAAKPGPEKERPAWLWPVVGGVVLLIGVLAAWIIFSGGEEGVEPGSEEVAGVAQEDENGSPADQPPATQPPPPPTPASAGEQEMPAEPPPPGWSHFSSTQGIKAVAGQDDIIWLGTSGGLIAWNRQTGEYEKYTTLDGLPYHNINSLVVDSDGTLWGATEGGGIWAFDGANWHTYTTDDGLETDLISVLFETDGGTLIAAAAHAETTFYRFEDDTWVADMPVPPVQYGRPIAIAEDEFGLAVGYEADGILYFDYDDEEWTHLTTGDGLPADEIRSLAFDEEGNFLVAVAGPDGFGLYDPPEFDPLLELADASANVIYPAPDGTVWLGLDDGTLWEFQSDDFSDGHEQLGLPYGQIRTLVQDEDGMLWIGVEDQGLIRFDGQSFAPYALENEPAFHEARQIVEHNGQLHFIHLWGDLTVPVYTPADDRWEATNHQVEITAMAFGPDGAQWLGTYEGLWRISPEGARRRFTGADGLPGGIVTHLSFGPDGGLWVGTEMGLAYHNPSQDVDWRNFTDYLPSPRVSALYTAPDGAVYIGTAQTDDGPAGLVWGAENFVSGAWLAGEGVPERLADMADFIAGHPFPEWVDNITALAVDYEGYLWVGTSGGGLWRWRQGEDWQQFDETSGATSGVVLTIAPMPEGTTWFGTDYDGLWGYNPDEGWWQETPEDGLPGWSIFASLLTEDGHLWLSTDGGIARLVEP
jgi:ligand-binding sensor domain-containing protein/tRNA A-37 threonylcarbamoyl transferase component Bud32